jgi:hypothetical protein
MSDPIIYAVKIWNVSQMQFKVPTWIMYFAALFVLLYLILNKPDQLIFEDDGRILE